MIKSKIGNQIYLYMIIVSLLPFIIFQIYLSQVYTKNMKESIHNNNDLVQQSCVNDFENFMSNIEKLSNACFDRSVQRILEDKNVDYASVYDNNEELVKNFNSRLELFDIMRSVKAVTVELDNEVVYQLKEKISVNSVIKKQLKLNLKEQYKYHKIQMLTEQSILYARNIYSNSDLGKYLGVIYIEIDKSTLEKNFEQYIKTQNSIIVITDENKEVIFSNYYGDETLGKFINEGYINQNYNIGSYYLKNYGINMYIYNDTSIVLQSLKQLNQWNFIIMLFALATILFLGRILTNSVVRPIIKLQEGVIKVKKGNFKWNIKVDGNNEITELCDLFNSMTNEIDILVNQVYLKEISENQAVIASLTAQINPHFLYNTLEMVKSMAEIEGITEIGEIAKSLSMLFRYNTKINTPLATVEEELNNLKHYIKIINARFGSKIRVNIEAEETVLKCSIIKLCLQPLLENSINHGLAANRGKGIITIKLNNDENFIYIQHIDSGVGMELDKMRLLQQELDENIYVKNDKTGGVGLNNINQRIKLYYGKEYGVRVSNCESQGFCVFIMIPLKYI